MEDYSSTVPLMSSLSSTIGPFRCDPFSGRSGSSGNHGRSGPYSASSANPLPFSAPIQTAYESEDSGHALQLTEEEKEVFETIKSRTYVDFLHLAGFGRLDGVQFFQAYAF